MRHHLLRKAAWLLALLFFLFPLAAPASDLPALTGRVVDAAGLIDAATEAAITAKLQAFEEKSSDQIVVATVASLDGEAIEPYANRLFRAWGLGQAGTDNGALLVVARDDRRMRIEVGYGLEGMLTDLHSKLIIENTMVPAFRAGDFAGGIARAVDDIITVLQGDAAELEARAEKDREQESGAPAAVPVFFVIWFSIFALAIGGSVLPPIFGRKIGPNRYRWLGMTFDTAKRSSSSGWVSGSGSGWSTGGGSGWSGGSSGGGGFSGGGGSSGGGGASGSW